ncbi:hypothetical protein [[Clostridium] colinum]|nr:hypothetical protein [[Clostridium] colinum]
MILKLEKILNYLEVPDLIFYNEKTPEEIIDIALSYKPIILKGDIIK